jgi:predicted RNA-binding Zn ribbon-like protein
MVVRSADQRTAYDGGMTIGHDDTGSRPAPGRLALVQAFVNTLDVESGRDAVSLPEGLARWLRRHGLLEEEVVLAEVDVERTIALREALRALLLAHHEAGAEAPAEAVATVNDLARSATLTVRLAGEGATALTPASDGLAGAHAQILAAVHDATSDGTWERLKACRNDRCHWAFYDGSKNRSGSWCSMAVCGSRMKSRAYRERRAPTS